MKKPSTLRGGFGALTHDRPTPARASAKKVMDPDEAERIRQTIAAIPKIDDVLATILSESGDGEYEVVFWVDNQKFSSFFMYFMEIEFHEQVWIFSKPNFDSFVKDVDDERQQQRLRHLQEWMQYAISKAGIPKDKVTKLTYSIVFHSDFNMDKAGIEELKDYRTYCEGYTVPHLLLKKLMPNATLTYDSSHESAHWEQLLQEVRQQQQQQQQSSPQQSGGTKATRKRNTKLAKPATKAAAKPTPKPATKKHVENKTKPVATKAAAKPVPRCSAKSVCKPKLTATKNTLV